MVCTRHNIYIFIYYLYYEPVHFVLFLQLLQDARTVFWKVDKSIRTTMSVQQEETGAPVYRPDQDRSGNDDGRAGSLSRNRVSVNKVYAVHGLLLSGIGLALTVGNALKQGAFQSNSFSDLTLFLT